MYSFRRLALLLALASSVIPVLQAQSSTSSGTPADSGRMVVAQDEAIRMAIAETTEVLPASSNDPGQSPEIDRVKLYGPHVKKVVVQIAGDLGDNL